MLLSRSQLSAQNVIHDTVLLHQYNDLCNKYELESPDSLLKYASIQLILANKNNSVFHQIHAYTNLGVAYTRIFKFNDALTCYLNARDIIEKSNRTGVSALLGQIGYIYLRLNRKKESYKYFKLQEAAALKEENYRSYLSCIVNLSDYYNTSSELDSTIGILNKGLMIARKYKYHENEVIILDNIANAYYAKAIETNDHNLFRKVELYADTALTLHYQDKDSSAIFYIYGLLGALNMDLKNYAKSENYYNQYISYSQRTQDIINLKIGIDECSRLYALQGKFDKAFTYRLMYDSINKLYIDEETNKHVEELNTRYETEKKEQQNRLLKQQNELSTETIQRQKLVVYFIVIILIGSLIFGVLMYRVYQQKKKAHILISKQKEQVEQKQGLIEHQKQVIEEKQKEIVDSINYAKRIQYALLASEEMLNKNLFEHFVCLKPKDIVSGDFYWATKHNERFYFAVCDSTGHGVPGAFMSLLNIGFLSEAIKEKEISEPHAVFNYVRDRLIESIGRDEQQDGMDGILICIDKATNTITYSAANNSPLLIRDSIIIELKKDKMPVGKGEKNTSFNLYTIEPQKNDMLYLYTDGYADQFGGPKGKKFKYKQLNELLISNSTLPLTKQLTDLDKHFRNWRGVLEQVDDVCVIGIRF
ncbi:MAG: SpoIIE family protein phosphatase [Bacteroidota bacterium]